MKRRSQTPINLEKLESAESGENDAPPASSRARLSQFAGALVSAASLLPPDEVHRTCTRCRRRPNQRPCGGLLEVCLKPNDFVEWRCANCGDEGSIVDWRGTQWDLSQHVADGHVVPLTQVRASRATRLAPGERVGRYEVEAELIAGPFELQEPVTRKLRVHGAMTLHELHEMLHEAFDRKANEAYEFMFGAPYDRHAMRYTGGVDGNACPECPADTELTTLDELGLKSEQTFGYLFDYGEEWVHRVTVLDVGWYVGHAEHARVVERKGGSPPQYPEYSDDFWDKNFVSADLDEDDGLVVNAFGPYNANVAPHAEGWLDLDDLERMLLVIEAHLDQHGAACDSFIDSDSDGLDPSLGHQNITSIGHTGPLHALVHCLAESRLAENCPKAAQAFAELLKQTGSRHEAIHLLGSDLLIQALQQQAQGESIERFGAKN